MISYDPSGFAKKGDAFNPPPDSHFYRDMLSSLGIAANSVSVKPFAQQGMMGDYVDAPQTQVTNFISLFADLAALINAKSIFFHGSLYCTVFMNVAPAASADAGFVMPGSGPQGVSSIPFVTYSAASTPDGVTFSQNNFRSFESVMFKGLYMNLDGSQTYVYYTFNGVMITAF